jgi:hypothetical protein
MHIYNLPRFTSLFHIVGNNDITRPNIILPFAHAQKTTQDLARVNTNTHVKSLFKFPFFSENTIEGDRDYLEASQILRNVIGQQQL